MRASTDHNTREGEKRLVINTYLMNIRVECGLTVISNQVVTTSFRKKIVSEAVSIESSCQSRSIRRVFNLSKDIIFNRLYVLGPMNTV